jgi:hypothetical protein
MGYVIAVVSVGLISFFVMLHNIDLLIGNWRENNSLNRRERIRCLFLTNLPLFLFWVIFVWILCYITYKLVHWI